MDFLRRVSNPWSQEVLIGIAWDLLYAAIIAGSLFVLGHALYVRFLATEDPGPTEAEVARAATLPERITRHSAAARISHWVLAASVIVLLVTAFVPILGLKFPWVTVHWIAGLVLAAYTVFHAIHATARRTLHTMWVGSSDVREGVAKVRQVLGQPAEGPRKPGKWAIENKLFHHVSAAAGVVVVGTGLLMMLRVNTPFSDANPYMLSDRTWGFIFVLHGLAAVAFVATTIVHIYFAVRPEKRWITWSMIRGTISRRDYVHHHDPERWPVPPRAIPVMGVTSPSQPSAPANPDR